MKIFIALFTASILIMFVSSCGNQSEHEHSGQEPTGHVHHGDEHGIMLNEGKPWMANSETTQGIHSMSSLLDAFKPSGELEEYHSLQKDLMTEFNTILKECTMDGEAHDQLHNYLLPLKDRIGDLGSDDISKCEQSISSIKEYLNSYPQYFN